VYALGVVAFQLLCGALLFSGPAWEDFREQHLHNNPPSLERVSPRFAAFRGPTEAASSSSDPRTLLARLERASRSEQSPGAGALAAAYQRQVGEVAAQAASDSQDRSDTQRREDLATAANRSLDAMSEQLLEVSWTPRLPSRCSVDER
jgi:hypothetical protein